MIYQIKNLILDKAKEKFLDAQKVRTILFPVISVDIVTSTVFI